MRKYQRVILPKVYIQQFLYLGIVPSRIIGGMYFTTQRIAQKPNPFQHQWNFIAAGRFIKQKGFLETIELFARIKGLCSKDMGIYLLGEGPQHRELMKYVKQHALENIYFIGYKKDFENYLCWSSMVIKMADKEGNNSVVREALTVGIPVASTIETEECERLAQLRAIIPLHRNDLTQSAKTIVSYIEGNTKIDSQFLRCFAESTWSDKKVLDIYESL
jgi:glycosyltransferase involved in cell wall biosynthesis